MFKIDGDGHGLQGLLVTVSEECCLQSADNFSSVYTKRIVVMYFFCFKCSDVYYIFLKRLLIYSNMDEYEMKKLIK